MKSIINKDKRFELQARYQKLINKINIEKELLPKLSYAQRAILKNYIIESKRTEYGICIELGISTNELLKGAEEIIVVAEKILSRKQEIEYLLKRYGGKKSIEEMAEFLPESEKMILLEYMLSENPNSQKLKKEYGISASKIESSEMDILELLEEMYPKKLEIDDILEQAGGKDFVFNVFGKSLTKTQFEIMKNYTLSCLKPSVESVANSLKVSDSDVKSEDKFIQTEINKIIIVNNKILEALADPKVSGYRLRISASRLRKILSSMPIIHQEFANEYFGNGTSLNQMSRDLDISLGSLSSRKKHFFEIFYELSKENADELIVNENAKTFKISQRINRTSQMLMAYINKLATFEPDVNPLILEDQKRLFEKYLYPYLVEDENKEEDKVKKEKLIKIFEDYMLTPNGKSAEEIAEELGLKGHQTVYITENSIYNKLDYIIAKKIQIDDFYKKYGGEEGVEDLSQFLTEPQAIVLKNYFLSLDPYSNSKTLKLLGRAETGKNGFGSIREGLIDKFDEILARKKECQDFIANNGGIEFLTKFGDTLSEEHKFIFQTTMLDYHYTSLRDVSLKLGNFENYTRKARILINEKLKKVIEKEVWVQSVIEKIGDYGVEKIAKNLSDREKKIFFGFTLNCFVLNKSEFSKSIGERHEYVSDVHARLLNKINEQIKQISYQ